jgi:outer membrane protein assembly factor BamB
MNTATIRRFAAQTSAFAFAFVFAFAFAFVVAIVIASSIAVAGAGDWPSWRGPHENGASDEATLPTKFSRTENVLWKADMPGPAASTPIVLGDRVFLSTTDEANKKLLAMCLDRKTGKELWTKRVAEGFQQDDKSNLASPSPATDGKVVVFLYGTGDLVAFDLDGNEKWKRNLQNDYGKFAFLWTFSTSPLLYDGVLYMQVLQRDVAFKAWGREVGETDKPNESYLLALNPADGKELWRQVRPSKANAESLEAFTTPIPFTHDGRAEILVAGGDCLTGHDPKTGEELWRWGTWNPERIGHWRLVPSPTTGDGIILACAPKKSPVYAVKAGGKGTLTDEQALAWVSDDIDDDVSSDVSTPLFYKGHFYVMNSDRNSLACVEPKTGKVLWHERLPSATKIESSPTAGADKIYVQSHAGDVYVVKAGDKFELLHEVRMTEKQERDIRASISLASGCLFIRNHKELFCIGQ